MTWRELLLGICRKEGFRLKDENPNTVGCSLWSRNSAGLGWNFEVGSSFFDDADPDVAKDKAYRDCVREWVGDRRIETPEEAEFRLTAMGYDFDSLDDPRIVRELVFDKDSSEPF